MLSCRFEAGIEENHGRPRSGYRVVAEIQNKPIPNMSLVLYHYASSFGFVYLDAYDFCLTLGILNSAAEY
jgi:hypothetical protein